MPTPLETLGKINRDVETNTRAKEFANVARWLMVGKGNLGNAIHEAQANRFETSACSTPRCRLQSTCR